MTLMPEAALAREAGLRYATVCGVVNFAAGRSGTPIHAEIEANLALSAKRTAALLGRFITAV
jgi:5'-methylthioinosine phosphorylase